MIIIRKRAGPPGQTRIPGPSREPNRSEKSTWKKVKRRVPAKQKLKRHDTGKPVR